MIWILLGIYLIGMLFAPKVAKASLALWKECEKSFVKGKSTGGIMGFFLFPMSAITGDVGNGLGCPVGIAMVRDNPKDYALYVGITMMFWPAKLVLSAIAMFMCAVALCFGLGLKCLLFVVKFVGERAVRL